MDAPARKESALYWPQFELVYPGFERYFRILGYFERSFETVIKWIIQWNC